MELRAQAMASKDIAAFEQLLHEEYNDGPNTKADILEYMREVFARYDQIAMKYQKAPVELKMNTARVVQRLEFKVNQETQIIHDHELLMLRKSNGVWQISGGIKLGVL
ncbi:MAG: nuclear transport factor 2 family protein [Gammaproteobacteria bacterium]|nr:nuclear transport factor 2 family protein [Gammaproteobacteria bacterium]